MNEINKNRPDVGAPERSAGAKIPDTAISDPKINCITPQPAGAIARMLPQGAENAICTKELVRLTGTKNARTLQIAIAAERESGALILSTTKGGYFLPDDGAKGQREIAEFVRTLRARAINTFRAMRSAKQALSGVEGQTNIEQWGQNKGV